ncbi:MAG TPA: M24 family metallopeptidase, partial [Thermodesulfovibrionales bacterium]|nr:M24 family metallopeptidase [Thermodesulfovibrionales bacterium]
YMIDMTRVFVIGDLSRQFERAFDESLAIQAWIADNLRPGKTGEEIYEGAFRMAENVDLGSYFMGQARFVGHGVGLELDELPVLAKGFTTPLQAGQTIAVEPKFVFSGSGAIGIENTFAVTQSTCERLTLHKDDIVRL